MGEQANLEASLFLIDKGKRFLWIEHLKKQKIGCFQDKKVCILFDYKDNQGRYNEML